jgi:hypothetical protein
VVAPQIADEAEYQRLLAEEKRSRAETRLNLRDRGDGTSDITARLPTPIAHRFRTYLDAHTSPRRHPLGQPMGDVDQLPLPRRRGEAFCALLENLPVNGLPKHGGTATSVMVILDLETLKTDGGFAETSTGDRITAEQARRLACQAGIIPVVLGGKGEVLDLGRTRRLFSPAQRKAMGLRDRHCTADGCDVPAAWCEVGLPRSDGHRHSGREATERCRDGDVSEGVQGPARRAASKTGQELHGSGPGVQRLSDLDRELGA